MLITFAIIVPDLLKWKKTNLAKIVSVCMNENSRRFALLPFMWQEERNCPLLIRTFNVLCGFLKMLLCPELVELLWYFIYAFTVIPVWCWDDIALGRAQWSSLDEGADCTVCCGMLLEGTKTESMLKEWRQICDPCVHLFCVFSTVWITVVLEFCLIIKNLK